MSIRKDIVERIVDRMLDVWESADRWTKGAIAFTETGQEVDATSSRAVKWCAVGCARRAMADLDLLYYKEEFEDLLNISTAKYTDRKWSSVASYNDYDGTSFEDVRLLVKCLKDLAPSDPDYAPGQCPCAECVSDRMSDNPF